MADRKEQWLSSAGGPFSDAAAVTPSDSVDLTNVARGLWVGGAGNISVITEKGTTVTFNGCLAGTVVPIRCSRVRATSTTATNILALD